MRFALLAYSNVDVQEQRTDAQRRRIESAIAEVLARPPITGWLRLQSVSAATTVCHDRGRTLLTDGPFVDSKDFLGGFILVEAESLDGALAVAAELQELQGSGAIEVRPVRELQRELRAHTEEPALSEASPFPDERLELIFTCCHPALALESQVALTLRTLGGLSTGRSRPPSSRARQPGCGCSTASSSTATATTTRPAPTCCDGWDAAPRLAPRTSARWS